MPGIICIGDNNVDIYTNKDVVYPGGNCLNVAAYCRINGYPSAYVGVVGDDRYGKVQIAALRDVGVDISGVKICEDKTAWSHVKVVDGDRTFIQDDTSIHQKNPVSLSRSVLKAIPNYDVIHTCRYSVLADGVLEQMHNTSVPVSYDFSLEWTDEELKVYAPFVDYAFLSCSHISEEETVAQLKKTLSYGYRLAVGTRGLSGSLLYDGKGLYKQRSYFTKVVDSLGAGDSFITRFLLTYSEGQRFKESYVKDAEKTGNSIDGVEEFESRLIQMSLSQATLFATKTCHWNGAFGHGIPYQPD